MEYEKYIPIPFANQQNPQAAFDILTLEGLMSRKTIDHSLTQLHRVTFYVLLLVTEGQGCHTIDFTDYQLEKGTILTIRKDQIHKYFYNAAIRGHLLLFTNDFLMQQLEDAEVFKTVQFFNERLSSPKIQLSEGAFSEVCGIVERMQKEYFTINDAHSMSVIRSELHILITKLFRLKSNALRSNLPQQHIEIFIAFQTLVEKHGSETKKVLDYAKMLGVSSKTLNTICKAILHKTAKTFIDEICVLQIKRLLLNTSLHIKEIAYQTGFEETTNLYKYFKRSVGCTPESFRATHR